MRWIVASLFAINVLALIAQLALSHLATPSEDAVADKSQAQRIAAGEASLQLLRELDPATRQAMLVSKSGSSSQPINAVAEGQPLCTMLGPFSKLLKAEYLVERLAALDLTSSVQDLEIPGDTSYWIYLPPRDSRKLAFNQLRELQAKGIDSYVIPKGELANGISFGMFSRSDLARNRLDDMRSQGYPAELKEITRSYQETWVVLAPGQRGKLDPASWQQILAENEGLERRQNFCPPVASE